MRRKIILIISLLIILITISSVLFIYVNSIQKPTEQQATPLPITLSEEELLSKIESIESVYDSEILEKPEAKKIKKQIKNYIAVKNNEKADELIDKYNKILDENTPKNDNLNDNNEVMKAYRIIDVETTDELKVIINKKHPLSPDYNPGEHPIAKKAFIRLKEDMQKLGFAVSDQYSGFRSYQYQKQIYDSYVKEDGQENADRYSARPGYSEHQSGLAFDFIDTTGQLLGDGIQDGAVSWLEKNAHQYGFVVRYLKGKEHITGYMQETWHVRFIGNDATKVYESGLTLEEYYGVEGGDYR